MDDLTDAEPARPAPAPPRAPGRTKAFVVPIAFIVLAALISITVIVISESDDPSVATKIRNASIDTRNWGTAKISGHVSAAIDGEDESLLDFTGATDFRGGNQKITVTVVGTDSEIRTVDGLVYFRADALDLPRSAHWVSRAPLDANLGLPTGLRLGTKDISTGLDYLLATARDIRTVGEETVELARTTHYEFVLDLSTLPDGPGTSGQIPAEVWIDSANRIRRLVLLIEVHDELGDFVERQDMRFRDFGGAVEITAPDADDVVPYAELVRNDLGVDEPPV